MNDSPSPSQSPPKRHSWKRALLTSALVFVIIFVAGMAIVATGAVQDEERFGYGLGRLAFVSMIIAYIVSYLGQTGHKGPAWGVAIVFVLLLGGSIVAVSMRMQTVEIPFSEQETQPLVTEGTGTSLSLVHPHLGFRITHPGPSYSELSGPMLNQMLQLMGELDAPVHGYGYENPVMDSIFFVMLVKGVNTGPECESFWEGFRSVEARGADIHEISSDPGASAVFDVEMPDGRIRFRALCTPLGPEQMPFLVMLSFSSATETDLWDIVGSFEIEGPI